MKLSTTLTYWKLQDKYRYSPHLERDDSSEEIEAKIIASEVEEQIESIMELSNLLGKITITIEAGE